MNSCTNGTCQRISNWYHGERKKVKYSSLPSSEPSPRILDLSGKSKRKKARYQPHQALSILRWRPKDSPLRREVEDLWARRQEDSVHETLKPFLKDTIKTSTSTSERLVFHMAVMRWKCSLMSSDELTVLNDWIEEQHALQETARTLPWAAEAAEHGDELFAENSYIQRCVIQSVHQEQVLTLYPTVALTTLHPRCSWPSRRLNGGRVGRRWSSSAVSNPEPEGFLVTCKPLRRPYLFHHSHSCIDT